MSESPPNPSPPEPAPEPTGVPLGALAGMPARLEALEAQVTHASARLDIFDEAFDQLDPQLEQVGQLARTSSDASAQAVLGAASAQGLVERMRDQLDQTSQLVQRHLADHRPETGELGDVHERIDRCAEDLEMLRRRVDAWQLMHAEGLRALEDRLSNAITLALPAQLGCGRRRHPWRLRLAIALRRLARWLEPQRK